MLLDKEDCWSLEFDLDLDDDADVWILVDWIGSSLMVGDGIILRRLVMGSIPFISFGWFLVLR